jgi:hypothetical protein
MVEWDRSISGSHPIRGHAEECEARKLTDVARTYKTKVVRLTDEELTRQLSELEAAHGMTSEQFLVRYNSGELGDDLHFIRWSGLLRMAATAGLSLSQRVDV